MKINRDKIGVITSAVCAVHCILLPFALVALPTVVTALKASWVHGLVLGIAFIPAVESLIIESYLHSKWRLVLSGIIGLILMFVGLIIISNESHHIAHSYQEVLIEHKFFLAGGLLLGLAHLSKLLNKNYCNSRQCQTCSD